MNHRDMDGLTVDPKKFNWSEKDIEIFREKVDYFKSFREKPINEENFTEICNVLYHLVDLIPLPTISIDLPFIVRSRPNNGTVLYKEEWEISYNSRAVDFILLGRFNRPKESMFYGCGFGENANKNDFILTTCLESCKRIIDPNNHDPYHYFTIGQWNIYKPFEVINLCYNDRLLAINPKMKQRVELFIQDLEAKFGEKAAAFICEFWKFLSDLAARKEEIPTDHFMTTAFFALISTYYLREMNSTINGIFYPSPITNNEGINLVLSPKTVDQYLKLVNVCMVKFQRHKSDLKHYNIFQFSEVAEAVDGKFNVIINDDYESRLPVITK